MLMRKTQDRFIAFLLVLILVFTCVIVIPMQARAGVGVGVLTLSVPILKAVAALLVGFGIVAAADQLDELAAAVVDKLVELHNLPLVVMAYVVNGISYVGEEFINMVSNAVLSMDIMNPPDIQTAEYNGRTVPIYDGLIEFYSSNGSMDCRWKDRKAPSINTFSPVYSVPTECTDETVRHTMGDDFYFTCFRYTVGNSIYDGINIFNTSDDTRYMRTFFGYAILENVSLPVLLKCEGKYVYTPVFGFVSNPETLTTWHGLTTADFSSINWLTESQLKNPSICPSYGKTDDVLTPGIGADSVPKLPTVANPAIPIPGVGIPGIPLTIPDNPANVTQPDIWAGNPPQTKPVEGALDKAVEETLDKMKTPPSLAEKFPFSIPFDVIRGIKLLAAPGVAPIFEIPLKAPEYGLDYTFKMDWSHFEEVIAVLRWGEFFVFLIALAVATKKIIWS